APGRPDEPRRQRRRAAVAGRRAAAERVLRLAGGHGAGRGGRPRGCGAVAGDRPARPPRPSRRGGEGRLTIDQGRSDMGPERESSPAPAGYRWYVVGMLWWVSFFNYADRQAVFSVFPLLQEEMRLN